MIVPSIFITLGIGLLFDQLGFETTGNGLGSVLTNVDAAVWALIMFAVFNRFDPAYEEAARDLGATPWQVLRHVLLPIIDRASSALDYSVLRCRLMSSPGR